MVDNPDIAVLELREGTSEFVDNCGNQRTGRPGLFPSVAVLSGKRVATPYGQKTRSA
jgi:hypothetical protein